MIEIHELIIEAKIADPIGAKGPHIDKLRAVREEQRLVDRITRQVMAQVKDLMRREYRERA